MTRRLYRLYYKFFIIEVQEIKNLDLPVDVKGESADEEDSNDMKMNVLAKVVENEKCALLALDGFMLILNGEGDITFVSENITEYLGLSKVNLKFFG